MTSRETCAPRRNGAKLLAPPLAAAGLLALAALAAALPTNPDPCHTANCMPWSTGAVPFNPGANGHQHRTALSLFNVNGSYLTYSVWDDRAYRYNVAMDRPLSVAAGDPQDLGHGFITAANQPRFYFDPAATPPAWAQGEIQQVINQWSNMINGGGNNVNAVPIQTQALFQPNGMIGGEIKIRWAPNYPVGPAGGGGGTQNFPSQIYPDGGSFPVPAIPGGGPKGGRSGVLAYWTPSQQVLTFNSNVNWYMSTGNAANDNNPNFMPNQFDFYTTALHEWGHVLGLDHPNMPGAASTMQPTQPDRGLPAGIIRTIDNGSLDGAKNLYTVNVCPPVQPGMPNPCAVQANPVGTSVSAP